MYEGVMDDIRTCVSLGTPKKDPRFRPERGIRRQVVRPLLLRGDLPGRRQDGRDLDRRHRSLRLRLGSGCRLTTVSSSSPWASAASAREISSGPRRTTSRLLRRHLKGLKVPNPQSDGRMPEKLKALELVRRHFGDRACVCRLNRGAFLLRLPALRADRGAEMIYTDRGLLRGRLRVLRRVQTGGGWLSSTPGPTPSGSATATP